jgi:tRNA G18 (ribose-2'-O)-methylase SpoU
LRVPRLYRIQSLADPTFAPFAPDYANVKERQLAGGFTDPTTDSPLGKLYAEGQTVLHQLVRSHHRTLSVLTTDARLPTIQPDLDLLAPDVPVFILPQPLMDGIVGFHIHRGLLAVAARAPVPTLDTFLHNITNHPGPLVVLEDLANHDNVGGIFRNAAAFGAAGILLAGTCADPLYRKSIRVSCGHALRLPWTRTHPHAWPDALATLHHAGWSTLALTPLGDQPLDAVIQTTPPTHRLALLIGAEGPGLRGPTMSRCTHAVRLQMAPGVDSLNASVAAAIALYELSKQPSPPGRAPRQPKRS